MILKKLFVFGLIAAVLPAVAEEGADRKTATSLKYVTHELDTRQNKFTAEQNKAMEYTDSAGIVQQRTVKSDLGTSTTDTSLPMVGGVNVKLATKQDDIAAVNDHTAVTYTGQPGDIGRKGIYQTTGTYTEQADNLIDAKTFNAAIKNGLDSEFKCREDNRDPVSRLCWLYTIHNGTVSLLPPEYVQLEYLESTGSQYINTGYNFNTSLKFDVTFIKTGANTGDTNGGRGTMLFGTNGTGGTENMIGWNGSNYMRGYTDGTRSFTPTVGQKYNIIADFTIGNTSLVIDGVSFGGNNKTGLNSGPMFLFAVQSSTAQLQTPVTFTQQKIYSFKLWSEGNLVRDLVPAKRINDNALGLYDMVSNTLLTNEGSGDDFTPGPPANVNVYIPQNQ